MDVTEMFAQGLQVMGIGVCVVFAALGLFYLITKVLMKIWPAK